MGTNRNPKRAEKPELAKPKRRFLLIISLTYKIYTSGKFM
jgi:hypothetical protein